MNYGDIKSHFDSLLNRGDITATLTTTFIDQGISRIQRQLRTPLNENVSTYSISGQTGSFTLPNDFLEIISLYYDDQELQRIPMSKYRAVATSPVAGSPTTFVRQQSTLNVHPQPTSGNLVLYYYGEFPAMTANSDENALAAVAPDLIIYAALTYASDYYLDERAALFETKYNQFLSEIQEQANDQEMNGGIQSIQPTYTFTDYQSSYNTN
jgi:hypothetical protein